MKREMSVAGAFYPESQSEIERYFEHFTKMYDEHLQLPDLKTRALIVPHAGYIYSGFTANAAYRLLASSGVKNVVVIGPSHKVRFFGSSMCVYESYETPLGQLPMAHNLASEIMRECKVQCVQEAHIEHSTEVQFPFIKHYLPDVSVVEIVYGGTNPEEISKIIELCLQKENTAVVISTDLSHFYTLEEANQIDAICVNAIADLDIEALHSGCEACGKIGVEAMMLVAKKKGLHVELLDYRTSADASSDKSRVVGYLSACFSGF
jgi:hypothetical protein